MIGIARVAWRLTKGYRLRPWDSPCLKWRIETWSGVEAASITPQMFRAFVWRNRRDLLRYMRWAAEESARHV